MFTFLCRLLGNELASRRLQPSLLLLQRNAEEEEEEEEAVSSGHDVAISH